MTAIYCFPSSLLRPGRVDEAWEEEAHACGLPWMVYSPEEDRLWRRQQELGTAQVVYRGWILSPEAYRSLEAKITSLGGSLLVPAEAYQASQFASGWLPYFEGLTFPSLLLPQATPPAEAARRAGEVLGTSGAFVVKGESKSLKHLWASHMFAPTWEALPAVVEAFQEEVSPEEEPQLLLRQYKALARGEARTWWVEGRCTLVEQHAQDDLAREEFMPPGKAFLNEIAPAVQALDCALVTVDVASLAADGSSCVVEVGCGQVSEARHAFARVVSGTSLGW